MIAPALLVLGSLAVSSIFTGCGDDGGTACIACQTENTLTFTRGDGSEIHFPINTELSIGYQNWYDDDYETTLVLRVECWAKREGYPEWGLLAAVSDVRPGEPMKFTRTRKWNPVEGVYFSLSASRGDQWESFERDAGGSITFYEVPWQDRGFIAFRIDGVLGSYPPGVPPVRVRGNFRNRLTSLQSD
jgi:hypothetical protein